MMRMKRSAAIVALGASVAMLAAACGGGTTDDATTGGATGETTGEATGGGEPVEMTFWHNSTTGEGRAYWEDTVAAFEAANPGVTITIQAIQNEDLDGKLQTALNSGDAPDIFMQRGGGKLTDMVAAGQVMDISDMIDDATRTAVGEGALAAYTIDDAIYAMPTSILPGGMFYAETLFEAAGIDAPPADFVELGEAVEALKGTGVSPIALGGKDAWPAAHWYYFFALRQCSQDALDETLATRDFSDECWLRAGENLRDFAATEPFNQGFLTTSAQQGAGSSAGLVANHQAAMELMGAWNTGVIRSLTPDQQDLPDLNWFPFPAVEGGEGDPKAMMGGVDGFSCAATAPAEQCGAFLNFFMQQEYQEGYAIAYGTIPTSKDAQDVVELPSVKSILEAYNEAPYVTLWLDTHLGQNVGNALNAGVVEMLAGNGTPEGILQAVTDAAARG